MMTIKDTVRDKIITLHEKGLKNIDIAETLDVAPSSVSRLVSVYDALKAGNPLTEPQRRLRLAIDYCCTKLGLDQDEVLAAKPEPKPEPESEQLTIIPPQRDNTALAFAGFMDALKGLTDAIRAIDDRLTAMQMTIQGHRGEARVYTDKIVEAININGDIVSKEHRVVEEKLERIQINTKRLRKANDND